MKTLSSLRIIFRVVLYLGLYETVRKAQYENLILATLSEPERRVSVPQRDIIYLESPEPSGYKFMLEVRFFVKISEPILLCGLSQTETNECRL